MFSYYEYSFFGKFFFCNRVRVFSIREFYRIVVVVKLVLFSVVRGLSLFKYFI